MADAPDSKSGGVHSPCGFESHLRHQHFVRDYRITVNQEVAS